MEGHAWSHHGGIPRSHWGRSLPGPAAHARPSWLSGMHCSPGWPKHRQGAVGVPSPARQDVTACTAGLAGVHIRIFPLLSHHPPAAGSWDEPRDLPGLGGEGAFWTAATTTGEVLNWPLPFPAQHGQEHELLLWHRGNGSRTTCPASPSPQRPPEPPKPAQSHVHAWCN